MEVLGDSGPPRVLLPLSCVAFFLIVLVVVILFMVPIMDEFQGLDEGQLEKVVDPIKAFLFDRDNRRRHPLSCIDRIDYASAQGN